MILPTRPCPPADLVGEDAQIFLTLRPAPEIGEWVQRNILADDGPIHNPDHSHLIDADLCFLWTSTAFTKQGRTVLGQCEQVMFRAGGWQKARQEREMRKRFVYLPVFIIALPAGSAILTAALWLNLG